jgi:hypothetical protein
MDALVRHLTLDICSNEQLYPEYSGISGHFGGFFHFFTQSIVALRTSFIGRAHMACYYMGCEPKSAIRSRTSAME